MSTNSDISSSGVSLDAPNQISEHFSDYQELPSSGFNRLFKAKKYGKWYVLKGLKPEYAAQSFYRDLLLKEFELGVQLDHVNIVRIIDCETNPIVGLCIVMEYVDGQTLSEFLKTKPTSTVRLKVVSELLHGMVYFHGKQITHRDLKPSNILITYNGNNVKIIDFGLSDSDYHSILKQPAGTAKYAAPEQLKGETVIDCRADIYAFGLILRLIFPHKYRRIVNKCTQTNRTLRFANISEISHALTSYDRRLSAFILLFLSFIGLGVYLFMPIITPIFSPQIKRPLQRIVTIDSMQRDTFIAPSNAVKGLELQPQLHKIQSDTLVVIPKPLIPAPAGRQIGKGEDKMALPEKEVLDSLAARYERIYLRELAKCGSKGNYRKDFYDEVNVFCKKELTFLQSQYENNYRIKYQLDKFSLFCINHLSEKYESQIKECQNFVEQRENARVMARQHMIDRMEGIEAAVILYVNRSLTDYEFYYDPYELKKRERMPQMVKQFPTEAVLGRKLAKALTPIYENTAKKMQVAPTLAKQIEVLRQHCEQIFQVQRNQQKSLITEEDIMVFQSGFYRTLYELHPIIAPECEFELIFGDTENAKCTIEGVKYIDSSLSKAKGKTDEERMGSVGDFPLDGVHTIQLYKIPTKQYFIVNIQTCCFKFSSFALFY